MRSSRLRVHRTITLCCIAAASFLLSGSDARAMPMWARRYELPCSSCHSYPSLQLTAMGLEFYQRGHRFTGDTFDKDWTHLVSAHVEWEFAPQQGEPSNFTSPDLHLHAGGALAPLFSLYADANINNDFEVIYLQLTKDLGKESYFTTRAGKMTPSIIRNYANGLMASASTPLIITDATLEDNPFNSARDSYGVSVAFGGKSFFVEGGVLNGDDVPGQASVGNHKDAFVTAEVKAPDGVSGAGLYYFRGGYDLGADPTVFLFDRYDRQGVFANYTRDLFRIAGAYLYGVDQVETLPNRKIRGYYAQVDGHPGQWVAPFVRYDEVTTESENGTLRTIKGSLGTSIQLFANEVNGGRVVVEVFRRRDGSEWVTGGVFNVLWAF